MPFDKNNEGSNATKMFFDGPTTNLRGVICILTPQQLSNNFLSCFFHNDT